MIRTPQVVTAAHHKKTHLKTKMEVARVAAVSSAAPLVKNALMIGRGGAAFVAASAASTSLSKREVHVPAGGQQKQIKKQGSDVAIDRPGLYLLLLWYTGIGAAGFGLSIFFPSILTELGFDEGAHIASNSLWYQMLGAGWLSISWMSFLAMKDVNRLKFAPLYLWQLSYKALWLVLGVLPRLLNGEELSRMNWLVVAVMLSFVVVDIIVLPWDYLLGEVLPVEKVLKK